MLLAMHCLHMEGFRSSSFQYVLWHMNVGCYSDLWNTEVIWCSCLCSDMTIMLHPFGYQFKGSFKCGSANIYIYIHTVHRYSWTLLVSRICCFTWYIYFSIMITGTSCGMCCGWSFCCHRCNCWNKLEMINSLEIVNKIWNNRPASIQWEKIISWYHVKTHERVSIWGELFS